MEEVWIRSSVGRITTVISRCHLSVLSNVYGKTYRYSWKCKTPCILSRSPCNKATWVLLPLALCFFAFLFFLQWPRFNTVSGEKHSILHCLAIWRIHRDRSWASDRPSLTCLFASEGSCLWTSTPENFYQCLWWAKLLCLCSAMIKLCVSNMSVRLGFSHDCGRLKVLVCLSQIE